MAILPFHRNTGPSGPALGTRAAGEHGTKWRWRRTQCEPQLSQWTEASHLHRGVGSTGEGSQNPAQRRGALGCLPGGVCRGGEEGGARPSAPSPRLPVNPETETGAAWLVTWLLCRGQVCQTQELRKDGRRKDAEWKQLSCLPSPPTGWAAPGGRGLVTRASSSHSDWGRNARAPGEKKPPPHEGSGKTDGEGKVKTDLERETGQNW